MFVDLGKDVTLLLGMAKYPFKSIEAKWQAYWERNRTFEITEDTSIPLEKRRYVLDMFPYPSGAGLHVGHLEGYTATDIYCRFLRMRGFNVLHPMGFDSFGLPAENYALKTGTHPKITTEKNIDRFRSQIKSLGFCYDWSREVSTHTPDYYRWTQWIFLQLYKKGLAYEAEAPINWCSSCMTGLANEEVINGTCDRCGHLVRKKNIRQWILRITDYAEKLLESLDSLDWPDKIKTMQRNWIGRSTGADVRFSVEGCDDELTVYTTRPDTLFGATYMVLAPENTLVEKITLHEFRTEVREYIQKSALKSDMERVDLIKEKSGVFTGAYAINPVNGERIPIWIADYVLSSYGTGAIMAVPAHDQRDWEFAVHFNLPIVEVLEGGDIKEEAFVGDGLHINSGFLDGLNKEDAIEATISWLESEGVGKRAVNYKLRDWIFSRQRYWGEPIPLVHCPECGVVPLPEEELPLLLPDVESYSPSASGESPLARHKEWLKTSCPSCGGTAHRETNTMPQWAGSCWYYLRYLDPKNEKRLVSQDKESYWMPVDLYVGGEEHAVLHLLYARFWHKVLYELGVVKTPEPFGRLVNQGVITSYAYQRSNGSLVPTDEVEPRGDEFVEVASGEVLQQVVAKMSKSLKNAVNPDEIIEKFGADSTRLYEMFMGPLELSKPWQTNGIMGVHRFLERVWRLSERPRCNEQLSPALLKLLHQTIKKVCNDTDRLEFNTAISQMMILVNELYKLDTLPAEIWDPLLRLLCPYAPHIAEELWELNGNTSSLSLESFPEWKEELTVEEEVTVILQVNGKTRGKLVLPTGTPIDVMKEEAGKSDRVVAHTGGKELVKVIAVPDKLVNFVVR